MNSQKQSINTAKNKDIRRERAADFSARYANNVFLESSLWDLKIIFGQTDLRGGAEGNIIWENGSVTIPWPQVKIFAHFLGIHLEAHEIDNGRIKIPPGIIPPPPAADPQDANSNKIGDFLQKKYEEFIAANPEAAPKIK